MTPALRVRLCPSRALAALVVAGHAAALACIWIVLQGAPAFIATVGLVASAAGLIQRWVRQPVAIEIGGRTEIRVVDRHGEVHPAVLLDARVPVWWLAVLRCRVDGVRPETIMVLPDSTTADEFRRLRAWLRRSPANARRLADDRATGESPKDPTAA